MEELKVFKSTKLLNPYQSQTLSLSVMDRLQERVLKQSLEQQAKIVGERALADSYTISLNLLEHLHSIKKIRITITFQAYIAFFTQTLLSSKRVISFL